MDGFIGSMMGDCLYDFFLQPPHNFLLTLFIFWKRQFFPLSLKREFSMMKKFKAKDEERDDGKKRNDRRRGAPMGIPSPADPRKRDGAFGCPSFIGSRHRTFSASACLFSSKKVDASGAKML
jgi:hypothetical protein